MTKELDLTKVTWDIRKKVYRSTAEPNIKIYIPATTSGTTSIRLNKGAVNLVLGSRMSGSVMFGVHNHSVIVKKCTPTEHGAMPLERDKQFNMAATWIVAKLGLHETKVADLDIVSSDVFVAQF